MTIGASYVLPLRWDRQAEMRRELAYYLLELNGWIEDVLVVDGSDPEVFAANGEAWGAHVRHVRPAPLQDQANGKVAGVLTGVRLARSERIVIADDDVRYHPGALDRVTALLVDHDLVRPQNVFSPCTWPARWDTARSLINRAVGRDFPGTLGVRRSCVLGIGGYDGDVLFENLELIRTVAADGGRISAPLDLYVRRVPPTLAVFRAQRIRQAYEEFALPPRMAVWLAAGPLAAAAVATRRFRALALAAAATVACAEAGRRRGGGRTVFDVGSSLIAPAWLLERSISAWIAVSERARFGGLRYRGQRIRIAAHSPAELSRRRSRTEPQPISRASEPASRPSVELAARSGKESPAGASSVVTEGTPDQERK